MACPFMNMNISSTENVCPFASKNKMNKQVKRSQDYLENPQLALAMKEGTKVIHTAAENSVFTKRFLGGNINRDEYGRYINSLYFVYKTLEELLEKHKDHPVVKNIYFSDELNREKTLLKDLEYYYGNDHIAKLIHFKNITPAVKNYIKALNEAAEKDPSLLVAHSYTRYLGDLSGGQILAKRLKKFVLASDNDSYQGLEFYQFNNIGNHLEFKNFYRQCLDNVKVTEQVKEDIVAEAIFSFELNIALFDEVQELSQAKKLVPTLCDNNQTCNDSYIMNADWLAGFTTGTATLALGLLIYGFLI